MRYCISINRMKNIIFMLLLVLFIPGFSGAEEGRKKADEKKKGPPAAPVAVSDIVTGESEPTVEFVGTIRYPRVSKVASESDGLIVSTYYEEGETVKADQRLAQLSTDLLNASISGIKADYGQILVELEKAKKDFTRMNALYKRDTISESVFDEHFFRKKSFEKKVIALKASLDRMLLVKKKKEIKAPFDGIVIEKSVEKGEWVPSGGTVAVIAENSEVDIVVDVPETVLPFLTKGLVSDVSFLGTKAEPVEARFISVVPRGDISTRTFSIKLRLDNTYNLIEGMEARAHIPVGEKIKGLLVPRDSVIKKYGKNVVFTVSESKAKMVPVKITSYSAMMVGISGAGLSDGMKVIVKGNERVRNGQAVRIIEN